MASAGREIRAGPERRGYSRRKLLRFLHQDDFLPAIITAVRAGLVWHLLLVAMGTLGERLRAQEVVRSPAARSCLGMSSLRICHMIVTLLGNVLQREDDSRLAPWYWVSSLRQVFTSPQGGGLAPIPFVGKSPLHKMPEYWRLSLLDALYPKSRNLGAAAQRIIDPG
jgi:hypothetical protein